MSGASWSKHHLLLLGLETLVAASMLSLVQQWEKFSSNDELIRLAALVAATAACLGSGTNYAYSAWAPQFSERLHLTSAQSNLIGIAGNVGQSMSAIPIGLFIDSNGPKVAAFFGAVAVALGYGTIYTAYINGRGSMTFSTIWFMYFLTGIGSFSAFSAAIKITAFNWPQQTGAATSLPLSAFGLSAFVFTMVSRLFQRDQSGFLFILAAGAPLLIFVSFPFFRSPNSKLLNAAASNGVTIFQSIESHEREETRISWDSLADENMATSSGGTASSEPLLLASTGLSSLSQDLEISIQMLLCRADFWLLFIMFGLYTGIGSMTINNIGHDATMLWRKADNGTPLSVIQKQQLLHVSIISVTSFCGRIMSGTGSDFLVRHQQSRFSCVVISSFIFLIAQLYGMWCSNPNLLWILSVLTGLAYGTLYGVYAALVTDTFGLKQLSRNYGIVSLAPILWSSIFNLNYGRIVDRRSGLLPGGERQCVHGLQCYAEAYWYTLAATVVGSGLSLWCIQRDHRKRFGRRSS